MSRRTIAGQRAEIEASALSPSAQAAAEAEVKAAANQATVLATGVSAGHYARAQDHGRTAHEAAQALTVDAKALAEELRSGRLTAAEARPRFAALEQARAEVAGHRNLFETAAAAVFKIEVGPEEVSDDGATIPTFSPDVATERWADDLYTRYPSIAPDFEEL